MVERYGIRNVKVAVSYVLDTAYFYLETCFFISEGGYP